MIINTFGFEDTFSEWAYTIWKNLMFNFLLAVMLANDPVDLLVLPGEKLSLV